MRLATLIYGCFIGVASANAVADIYGYIDAQGVAHFSTEKLDERYQLFLRGDKAFDSSLLTTPAPPIPITMKPALVRYLSDHPNLKKYESLLERAAREFSIDVALLKAVMAAESGFNPGAISPKGAVGLMQIMPATAARYGLRHDASKSIEQKLTDPKTNIWLGARYLRDLHRLFPDELPLILASYNAGEGAVQKYNNTIPPYPETRNYVQIVTQLYQLYRPAPNGMHGPLQSHSGAAPKRISMTIPGRRNMPNPTIQPD